MGYHRSCLVLLFSASAFMNHEVGVEVVCFYLMFFMGWYLCYWE
jgi:hypothetical protein